MNMVQIDIITQWGFVADSDGLQTLRIIKRKTVQIDTQGDNAKPVCAMTGLERDHGVYVETPLESDPRKTYLAWTPDGSFYNDGGATPVMTFLMCIEPTAKPFRVWSESGIQPNLKRIRGGKIRGFMVIA